MANSIGDVKSVNGTSMGMNGQNAANPLQKPTAAGNPSPGGTKPPMPMDGKVAMPK